MKGIKSKSVWSLVAAAALTFSSIGLSSPSSLRVKINSYGSYRDVADDRQVELVRENSKVDASLGTSFGYRYTISGLAPGSPVALRMVTIHPAMRMPDGTHSTGYERESPGTIQDDGTLAGFRGFKFDHDYELVPGIWRFEIWYGNHRIASKTFTVLRAKP